MWKWRVDVCSELRDHKVVHGVMINIGVDSRCELCNARKAKACCRWVAETRPSHRQVHDKGPVAHKRGAAERRARPPEPPAQGLAISCKGRKSPPEPLGSPWNRSIGCGRFLRVNNGAGYMHQKHTLSVHVVPAQPNSTAHVPNLPHRAILLCRTKSSVVHVRKTKSHVPTPPARVHVSKTACSNMQAEHALQSLTIPRARQSTCERT